MREMERDSVRGKPTITKMLLFALACLMVLSGCGRIVEESQQGVPVEVLAEPDLPRASVAQVLGQAEPTAEDTPQIAELFDFDGDGKEDSYFIEELGAEGHGLQEGQQLYRITVELGSGITASTEFASYKEPNIVTGHFSGRAQSDMAVHLPQYGDDSGDVHVLYFEQPYVEEYPNAFIQTDAFMFAIPESFATQTNGGGQWFYGIQAVQKDGIPYLRFLLQDFHMAQYIDARYEEEGWRVSDTGICSPEGGSVAFAKPTLPDPSNTLPSTKREGFQSPQIIFLNEESLPLDDKSVNFYSYLQRENILCPPIRDIAQMLFECLYDTLGLQVESCYARVSIYDSSCDMSFYAPEGDSYAKQPFFTGRVDILSAIVQEMSLVYKEFESITSSPLSIFDVERPQGYMQMDAYELAKWYYIHSSFGDRRAVVSTDDCICNAVRLYLSNGEAYEVNMDMDYRVPTRLYGIYAPGYLH